MSWQIELLSVWRKSGWINRINFILPTMSSTLLFWNNLNRIGWVGTFDMRFVDYWCLRMKSSITRRCSRTFSRTTARKCRIWPRGSSRMSSLRPVRWLSLELVTWTLTCSRRHWLIASILNILRRKIPITYRVKLPTSRLVFFHLTRNIRNPGCAATSYSLFF